MIAADKHQQVTSIARFLEILHAPGNVFELRALDCPDRQGGAFTSIVSGYFNSAVQAAEAIGPIDKQNRPSGIYATLNPVQPALIARAAGRMVHKAKWATSDADILCRRWLLFDIDPVRPAKVSATDAEMNAALELLDRIHNTLTSEGWPAGLQGCSGNGATLLFRVDLPNDAGSTELIKRVLHGAAARFNTETAEVDCSTFNAGRIGKVFGTVARKGDHVQGIPGIEDRPHRRAWFIEPTSELAPVPRELLEALADRAPKPKSECKGNSSASSSAANSAGTVERCWAYVSKMPDAISGQHGHDATFAAACQCFHFGLSDSEARQVMDRFNTSKTGNEQWSDDDLKKKLSDAKASVEAEGKVGSKLQADADSNSQQSVTKPRKTSPGMPSNCICNGLTVGGGESQERFYFDINDIITNARNLTGDWPRQVTGNLFVTTEYDVQFLSKAPALFGFLKSRCKVKWMAGETATTKEEFFHEYRRTATAYKAVETFPHFPSVDRHFYIHPEFTTGDGSTLRTLLDRFTPATAIDRDLLQAAIVTPGWGGAAGARPAFLFQSDFGRGSGKTSAMEMIGFLWGGAFDFSAGESIEVMKKRLLSPSALSKRVCGLDNIKTNLFSWAELESLVTCPEISGHQMYVGENTRPNMLVFLLSINGPSLSRDLAQRCIPIKFGKPTYSDSWKDDTRKFIDENRWRIMGDIAAFFEQPADELPAYSRWGAWQRAVLCRLPEPVDAAKVIAERQAAINGDDDSVNELEDLFAERLRKLGYDPDVDWVHLPSELATRWYNAVTASKLSPTAITRTIKQAYGEGMCKRLKVNPSRAKGRGLLWAPTDTTNGIYYDIEEQIAAQFNSNNTPPTF